jgi:RimJ/RimL family protein N-acetyltransferase
MDQQDNDISLGPIVPNWSPRAHPLDQTQWHVQQGLYCRLELLNSRTDPIVLQQLFDVFKPTEQTHFKYLRYGPFQSIDEFRQFVHEREKLESNIILYTIFVDDRALGFLSFLRVDPIQGTIEIGNINFSEKLVQTRAATESIFLLMQFAFDALSYRRVEWKCNALNGKSRQAALRFGFQYEGTWLKAEITKGRSRDHAWLSIVDDEWRLMKAEFQRWLDPANFDTEGNQRSKLNEQRVNFRRRNIVEVVNPTANQ